jgi:Zn-dependent protease
MFNDLSSLDIVIVIVSIIISLSIHEAIHGFAAHWLGDSTAKDLGRLTLNPLKHIDLYTTILLPIITIIFFHFPFLIAKPVPFNPNRVKWGEYGAAIVGVAGPLTNSALAVVSGLILRFTNIGAGTTISDILVIFTEINTALFVINMIPIPPLDGSRLLYAFAPEPLQDVMAKIEQTGFMSMIIIFIVIIYILSPVISNIDTHLIQFIIG